jgi:hypothetical protein
MSARPYRSKPRPGGLSDGLTGCRFASLELLDMTSNPLSESSSSLSSQSFSPSDLGCSPSARGSSPIFSQSGIDDAAVSPADRLAGDLHAFERLLRQTLAAGGRLVTGIAEAQVERGLPVTSGHQIYHAFNAANLDLSTALGHVARGHRQLDVLAQGMGIDLTGYGKNHEAPAPEFFTSADASDSIVVG